MSDILNSVVQNASGTDNTVLAEKNASRNVMIAGALLTVIAMGLSFLGEEKLKLCLGFLLGGAGAQIAFLMNARNVDRSLKDPERMQLIQRAGYYLRLIFRGAVLLAAVLIPFTSVISAFCGLMTVPAAIYLLTLISILQMKGKGKGSGSAVENTETIDRSDSEGEEK